MKPLICTLLLLLTASTQADCVILLHGLARTEGSMTTLEKRLTAEGYHVVNLGYPSRQGDIEKLAKTAINPALQACHEGEEINFVTHSLGGILVRQYLSSHNINHLRYVVMLGPPNQGSEVVDKLHKAPGFHFLNGDAGLQLGTGELSIPNSLGAANFNLGIIAGTRSINLILSSLIPGKDDGKVAVTRTKLEGMNDHITIPTAHTFMMKNKRVIEQVIYYLKHGKFKEPTLP